MPRQLLGGVNKKYSVQKRTEEKGRPDKTERKKKAPER